MSARSLAYEVKFLYETALNRWWQLKRPRLRSRFGSCFQLIVVNLEKIFVNRCVSYCPIVLTTSQVVNAMASEKLEISADLPRLNAIVLINQAQTIEIKQLSPSDRTQQSATNVADNVGGISFRAAFLH